MTSKAHKSNLKIRLAESVVFLRGSTESTIFGRRVVREAQPAMLRGLLVLELDKPTKISSIELTFEGKIQSTWPEGVGARKIDVMEEQKVFSVSTTYFRAGESQGGRARRTASVGPGLHYEREDIEDDTGSTEDPRLVQSPDGMERQSSMSSAISRRRVSMDYQHYLNLSRPTPRTLDDIPTPPYSPPATRPASFRNDSSQSVIVPSPSAGHRADSWRSTRSGTDQHGVYEVRNPATRAHEISEPPSSASSIHSPSAVDLPLSRPQSHEDELNSSAAGIQQERSPSRGRTRENAGTRPPGSASQSRTASMLRSYPSSPFGSGQAFTPMNSNSPSASNSIFSQPQVPAEHASDSPVRDRGRRHARFSLAGVSNALLDAVKERLRSNSPHTRAGKERARTPMSRDQSPDGAPSRSSRTPSMIREFGIDAEYGRGRTRARDQDSSKGKEKERSTLGRISGALGLDVETKHEDNWKEFKKGSYTYPISFAIPGDSPPSLSTEFGSVTYQLKATVHRPGTFTHKLTASREVVLIASPGEDDLDESDNIVVQREWDSQMHYAIIISGRAFPIGSPIPVHITFMPLTKIKIFRVSAVVEEKIEYAPQYKRIPRDDFIRKFELLSIRHPGKDAPILPLSTNYEDSPLHGFVDSPDESEAASSVMGPGPWAIATDLKLPTSCSIMHFTDKHKRSHVRVSHLLKIIFRVERGDDAFTDAKTGARKHFDIVVQTPVHILSCRCNTEWTALPRYSFLSLDTHMETPACPCERRKKAALEQPLAEPNGVARSDTSGTANNNQQTTSVVHHHHRPFLSALHHTNSNNSGVPSQQPGGATATAIPISIPNGNGGGAGGGAGGAGGAGVNGVNGNMAMRNATRMALEGVAPDSASVGSLYRNNALFARLIAGEESEQGEAPPQYDQVVACERSDVILAAGGGVNNMNRHSAATATVTAGIVPTQV